MSDSKKNYEVGYSRPPKTKQFRKGQSGNPKGRPKGSKNMSSLFLEVASRKVTITESGRTRRVSLLDAVLTQMATGAAKGDRHSRRDFLQFLSTIEAKAETEESVLNPIERDIAVLDGFMKRFLKSQATLATPNDDQADPTPTEPTE